MGSLATLREAQFLTFSILMVDSLEHCMFMEMNRLDIMLVIEGVIELAMHSMSRVLKCLGLQMVRLWGLAIRLIVCSRSFLVVKVDLGLKMAEDRRVLQIIRIDGIMDHMALLHVAQVTVKSVTVRAIVTMITVC